MKFFKKASAAISLASIILGSQATFASLVPIVNPGFENPAEPYGGFSLSIPGWTGGGNWYPSAGYFNYIPLGNQAGYLNGGSSSQTLTTDLEPNTTYTLSIYIGSRLDGINPGTGYSIGLYGGPNLLASITPVAPPSETGTWIQVTKTYTSGPAVPLGELLGITISDTQDQLDFNDVTLTATSAVPEPTTMIAGALLLLPFGSGAVRLLRKKLQAA
jgi:hypothetical protein